MEINLFSTPRATHAWCIGSLDSLPPSLTGHPALRGLRDTAIPKWQNIGIMCREGLTVMLIKPASGQDQPAEHLRQAGAEAWSHLRALGLEAIDVMGMGADDALHFAEGFFLKDYDFAPYKSNKRGFSATILGLDGGVVSQQALQERKALLEGIYLARDLVNEPANVLTALELSRRIETAGKEAGFEVEVLEKAKIAALKMGGLLAVNQGSVEEPTFTIMSYCHPEMTATAPSVWIGKGIVYDTGGLSLKATPNSMDIMKSDMGGAAAVVGALYAIAKAGLKAHVVGLIPATDNRLGGNAYAPGDVITMHDGTRVEVMNTDAEGRLVLADALTYAQNYQPRITIDLATLTGSSMRTLGYCAAACMGTADDATFSAFHIAGTKSWNRLVQLPLWKDYGEALESDIADIKNVGSTPLAGAIAAGKFLEHFAPKPWIHVDLAGPAFLPSASGYLPKGGTGFGVGLLYHHTLIQSYS